MPVRSSAGEQKEQTFCMRQQENLRSRDTSANPGGKTHAAGWPQTDVSVFWALRGENSYGAYRRTIVPQKSANSRTSRGGLV
jgi:hypothetical protein